MAVRPTNHTPRLIGEWTSRLIVATGHAMAFASVLLLPVQSSWASLPREGANPSPREDRPELEAIAAAALRDAGEPIVESNRGQALVEAPTTPGWIHLGAGFEFNPSDGDPAASLSPEWRGTEPANGEVGYFIVQFRGPITEADRALLERQGVRLVSYVPDYSFLVSMTPQQRSAVASSASISWTGLYQPAWKISRQPEMQQPGSRDMVVLLFPDQVVANVSSAISLNGGVVKEVSDNGINKILKVELDTANLASVARIPGVAWIEPFHIAQVHNSSAQWVVQTATNGNRHVWDKGIKGQGQVINLSDSGVRVTHNQFKDAGVPIITFGDYPTHRKIIAYKLTMPSADIGFGDNAVNQYHGTHTSGTAVGDDSPNAGDARDGMAINAKLYFQDGGGATAGILTPLDLNEMFIAPYTGNAGGAARISTHSWGNPVGGAYDVHSMTVDQFMWSHPDFLIFFSNGNNGAPNTVGSPATAKSSVGAGGTGNGTLQTSIYSSTSRGPTDDGRRKPTFCAPGDGVSSSYGTGDGNYITYSGTSMASPAMAGATALIRQYLTDGWYPTMAPVPANAMNPSAALLKSMAIVSADPNVSGFTIPDNNIGWGRIDVDNVLPFSDDTIVRRLAVVDNSEGLLTGEFVEYQVYVAANTQPFKVSLCWTDYPGSPANSVQLVNNLNLVVTDPTSTVYRGNVYSGGQSNTGGSADNLNVEECVQRNTPAVGLWTIRIEGSNVPFGPQDFGLAVTGSLGSDQGLVLLDKAVYSGAGSVAIKVVDTNAAGSINVAVDSNTEGPAETVTLTGANGVFTGSIALSTGLAISSDGTLQVSDGDQITVTYNDANPVISLVAKATVNISGPALSDVHATTINETDATIAWTSTSPSDSRIYYGTTPALGSVSPVNPTLTNAHSVMLTGLNPNTTYYYDVESFDNQGFGVRDANGGLHYTFSTDQNRDVLLVLGDGSFDKKQYYVNALNRHGWTYTIWEGEQAATPFVGNLNTGMASYKAVIWQTGLEQYPMFTDAAVDSVGKLSNLGSRIALYSNDAAWDFCDPASPDDNATRCNFIKDVFKVTFQDDPLTFSSVRGIASDPISGAYTGGIPYTPHRDGAACDEIDGIATGGAFNNVWRNNDTTVDDIAVRWTSSGNVGDGTKAVWGGTPRKVSTNCFEWAHLNVANADDVNRADVLDKTLVWLIGHDHPSAAVTAPNGGETFTGSTINITWTEAADGGFSIATRKIYYSDNGGDSWNLISGAAGPSPFVWNISSIPNGAQYRVKVVTLDNASPALSAADASNANFTINRAGGDTRGPVVLAGSVAASPNPIVASSATTISATVSDITVGNSNIAGAEWSFGASPAPAGSGTAMSGTFTNPLVNVSVVAPANTFPGGVATLWVRGRDAAGNWGNATSADIQVNSATDASEGALPTAFSLGVNAPNPFGPSTFIHYALPTQSAVKLAVYDATGRLVRTLVDGPISAGNHSIVWDGADDRGNLVSSGIYFYSMKSGDFESTRKMTLLK